MRQYRSNTYNWKFNQETGDFIRWGTSLEDNPTFSDIGPEILDIEVSTICHGQLQPCTFCYKTNTPNGINMSLARYKEIFRQLPRNIVQVALGIGDFDANPELKSIITHTIELDIIPNITINGYRMTDNDFEFLAKTCGAISVSHYNDDTCFNAVNSLNKYKARQIGIQQIVSDETLDDCYKLLELVKTDTRLAGLDSIVFLMLKPKGRANKLKPLSNIEGFKNLVSTAIETNLKIGFDSCASPLVFQALKNRDDFTKLAETVEPCEAFLFSSYINVKGEAFPCSFCEGEQEWKTGIPVNANTHFINEVWNHPKALAWREKLINSSASCNCEIKHLCRSCPIFEINPCKNISINQQTEK
jgi:hypothetical protein